MPMMSKSEGIGTTQRAASASARLWLCAALILLVPPGGPAPAAQAMDLAALVTAFTGIQLPEPCPEACQCTMRRAQDVVQDYITRYLPFMAPHLQPQLESELRSRVAVLTAWVGNMADIRCHLKDGNHLNLTDVLQSSTLSFKSVTVTCQSGGFVVWDISPLDAFLSVLHLSGCGLEKGEEHNSMVVPPNLWVLELQGAPAEAVESLDFSRASQLRTFSFTHSNLSSVPQRWAEKMLRNLLFVSLAHNNLESYGCELNTLGVKTISLDYNRLTAVPQCFLDASQYGNHLSLRHNQIESLQQMFVHQSENVSSKVPWIRYLDLSHNQVDNLRALKKIDGMLALDLSHNHLESMTSDSFSLNSQLNWLDLSNNFLEHVADSLLSSLVNIKHLNLSHNSLRSFDFDLDSLRSQLVTLDLRYNHLIYPPFAGMAYTVPGHVQIIAGYNPYLCDCNIHAFLQQHNTAGKEKSKAWLDLSSIYSFSVPKVKNRPFLDTHAFSCARPIELKGVDMTLLNFQKVCPLPRGCPKNCRCELVKEGSPRVSVDCSKADSLGELPESLPFIPDTPLVLYVNQTALKRLDNRPYLHRVRELYADNSKLSTVTSDALKSLENISVLDLHHTQLRSLPAITQDLIMPVVTNISLSGNPWACGCRDLWMPDWLASHAKVVNDADQVICHWTGRPVTELTSSDLSCGLMDYLPFTIALSLVSGFMIIVLSILTKYKMEILVCVYKHTGMRPLDMFKYDKGRPAFFDVFVSFSERDYRWVVERLMEHLENRARPYRLCSQIRDFPVGAPFADSMAWAVENSRCTLLVLTRDFIANEWSRPKIRAAHLRLLQNPANKILVIIHGPLDARCLDREVLDYLRTHSYLRSEEAWFWSKLDYALPKQQKLTMLMPDCSMRGRVVVEETSSVTEIGSSIMSGGLAAGDITSRKSYTSSVSVGHC